MGNTQVLTLRIPMELKKRLERQAKYQGTSINQLTQLETLSSLESKLSKKSIPDLKKKVKDILEKIPDRPVPEWDSIS
ncbi:MAG: toxin-antitoxin system HicB family antitoxin [Candidatus Aminicenantes bacterium]|nr:MAG: toxin-antitoxin system HicB family antitoxin [Candidatus Aminicenantes bacterium]